MVPALRPVTIPEVLTVPTAVLVLLHTPPAVASLRDVVAPVHAVAVPETGAGAAGVVFTVTSTVAARVPQLLVTV